MFCPKCGSENPETGNFCRSCGTDLSSVSLALKSSDNSSWNNDLSKSINRNKSSLDSVNKKADQISDSTDIFSSGLKSSIMGFGFLVISILLFVTQVGGGWWAFLFPATALLATGISKIVKANKIEKNSSKIVPVMQNQISTVPANFSLPPQNQEFIIPPNSIYQTDELVVPPSITESTTRHLEINKEGETMTLPKKG